MLAAAVMARIYTSLNRINHLVVAKTTAGAVAMIT